ncbi:hypothetical protein ZIOFF_066851 [Zingiber officinale]|uniref:Regulatory particle non-ATPase 13 n=1 Tax=Zingiber officinale TaxID=94328 RepID=A0A8J5K806_ZINOF|nr:hypothetical protein ZIOFF_066851 [Zingiber officinale]
MLANGIGEQSKDLEDELGMSMLEFRAGKMFLDGTRVIPDTRRGLVRIGRGEEGLVHFQWLDRTQNIVEDVSCENKHQTLLASIGNSCYFHFQLMDYANTSPIFFVSQSSDRVYILRFNSDSRKFFFWMQEPRADEDSQICTSVNFYINQPLDLMAEDETEASVPLQMSDTGEDDFSSRAGNLVDHNMASELGGEVTSSGGPVRLEDLQRILRSIQTPDAVEDPDAGFGLADILKPDLILPVVETLPVEQHFSQYLPEGSWTPADLMELLQSPQFHQQVDTFTHVIRTGQIDLSQFGINPSKCKYLLVLTAIRLHNKFTVLSFLEALEDSVTKTSDTVGEETQRDGSRDAMDES